jgi:uncharacterized protein (DUF2249 family)
VPVTIDGRALSPPEPFELTMEALDGLAVGDEVLLILNCRPQPLYRVLLRNGFAWREVAQNDGSLAIHIYHRAGAAAPDTTSAG